MHYVIYYDISAIAVLIMLITLYFLRQNYPTLTNKMYLAMCCTGLLASITDLISLYTIPHADTFPLALNYIINMIYLLAYNINGVLFYIYVLTITKPNHFRTIDRIYYITILVIDLLILLPNYWTKMGFYFDETRTYVHGPLFAFMYISAIFLLIQIIIEFVYHRKSLNRFQCISIIFFCVATIGAVLFQIIFPSQMVGNFVSSLFLIVVYVSLQNPDYYIEKNTLCYNINAFQESLEQAFSKKHSFTLITFTLSGVAYINQVLGVQYGNELLASVIAELHETFGRKNIYRSAGNRFAIWLTDASEEERTISILQELFSSPVTIHQIDVLLTPYICVVRHPDFAETPADITNAINFAFRDLSQNQGQKVTIASADFLDAKRREGQLLHILRRAIQNEEFMIYYQPIYDTQTQTFRSAEALLRLQDDELGFIAPDEFIPMAEQNGMIIDIGDIVFRNVCRFLQKNDLEHLGIEYIEVNLSTVQCIQDNLSHRLVDIMKEYQIRPEQINFEITETAGSENEDMLLRNMNNLIATGSSFSMDDYGTGFSTANYLINLPMHIVKIDKSILWPAMKDSEAFIILQHTIAMLKALHKKIVVEGVETQEMADVLIEMHCDYLQGYLYSKPLPEEQYVEFLKSKHYDR